MKRIRWICLALAPLGCSPSAAVPMEGVRVGVGDGSADGGAASDDAPAEGAAMPSPDASSCARQLPTCPAPPTMPPSYESDVAPIITRACAACHYPGSDITRGVYSTYAELDSNRGTVLNEVYSCKMPEAPVRPLTPAERLTILTWIECGAPNN